MKIHPRLPLAATLCGVAFALVLAPVSASAAEKKEKTKHQSGTYSNSKGKSGTVEKTTTKKKGERKTETKVTNQDGATGTRTTEQHWDKETQTGTHTATTTLPNGQTATSQGTLKKNEDGTLTNDATRTGFNGQTQTIHTTTTKTENGHTTTGTITNQNGQTATLNTTATQGDGQTHKTTTVTGQNGQTHEREISTKKNADGTTTRVVEITKPDGTKETRTETLATTTTTP